MKHNNESKYFKDWTTKRLMNKALEYHESIYKIGCYGIKDLRNYDSVLIELKNRGVDFSSQLTFI